MKKEIGSIFPLSDEDISAAEKTHNCFTKDRFYYSLCREALFDIAMSLSNCNREVLIPAYTCQTVITPFEEAGWKCEYYAINKDLRINTTHLTETIRSSKASLLIVHPYFGMELSEAEIKVLQHVSDKGIKIILDLTQCIFSIKRYSFVTYTIGSYRKWFPIPDGGFLERNANTSSISQPESENIEFAEREIAAMYLRWLFFCNGEQRTKAISIRLSKIADQIAENNIVSHKMSQVAYNLLVKEDVEINQECRFNNYSFLFNNFKESEKIKKVCQSMSNVTTAPLYFTIYVQDRPTLQRLLAQNSIYAPLIWPVEDERVLIDSEVKYIYDHILAIPCDQRYDEDDMRRVVEIINNY